MATYEIDKKMTDHDVILLLDDVLCKEDYPNPDNIDLVDLKEYDRGTRQVFLWVSSLFTKEEENFIEEYMRENLHGRTRVSVCRSDFHFGYRNNELTDSD